MTVHNWGENPAGVWEIIITDNGDHTGQSGEMFKLHSYFILNGGHGGQSG